MNLSGHRVLVVGTSGAQGSGLVPAVLAHGAVPVRLTHADATAKAWREDGEEAVVADLTDTAAVLAAAREAGVAAVAGILPLALGTPERFGAAVGTYAALAGSGLPVAVNTGTPLPPPGAPDVMGARATADALAAAGVAVVTPTGYLENHVAPWALAHLREGELIYPRPAEDLIAWTAAADMGAAAVAAIATDVRGEVLALSGPAALTFADLAAELGAGTGRELAFRRVTPAEYGDAVRPYLGDQGAAGVEAAYASMPEASNPGMAPAEAAANWQRLGVRPTPVRQWAQQVLAPALGGPTG